MPLRTWWESRPYQLQTGKWVPEVRWSDEVPGGVESYRLTSEEGRQFDTEEEARAYGTGLANKWLKAKQGD